MKSFFYTFQIGCVIRQNLVMMKCENEENTETVIRKEILPDFLQNNIDWMPRRIKIENNLHEFQGKEYLHYIITLT